MEAERGRHGSASGRGLQAESEIRTRVLWHAHALGGSPKVFLKRVRQTKAACQKVRSCAGRERASESLAAGACCAISLQLRLLVCWRRPPKESPLRATCTARPRRADTTGIRRAQPAAQRTCISSGTQMAGRDANLAPQLLVPLPRHARRAAQCRHALGRRGVERRQGAVVAVHPSSSGALTRGGDEPQSEIHHADEAAHEKAEHRAKRFAATALEPHPSAPAIVWRRAATPRSTRSTRAAHARLPPVQRRCPTATSRRRATAAALTPCVAACARTGHCSSRDFERCRAGLRYDAARALKRSDDGL